MQTQTNVHNRQTQAEVACNVPFVLELICVVTNIVLLVLWFTKVSTCSDAAKASSHLSGANVTHTSVWKTRFTYEANTFLSNLKQPDVLGNQCETSPCDVQMMLSRIGDVIAMLPLHETKRPGVVCTTPVWCWRQTDNRHIVPDNCEATLSPLSTYTILDGSIHFEICTGCLRDVIARNDNKRGKHSENVEV